MLLPPTQLGGRSLVCRSARGTAFGSCPAHPIVFLLESPEAVPARFASSDRPMAIAPSSSASCSLRIDDEEEHRGYRNPSVGVGVLLPDLWHPAGTVRLRQGSSGLLLSVLLLAATSFPSCPSPRMGDARLGASDDHPPLHLRLTGKGTNRRHPSREAIVLGEGVLYAAFHLQPVAAVLLAPRLARPETRGLTNMALEAYGRTGHPPMPVRAAAARLSSPCSGCGHSEFVHSDRQARPCLFNRCRCLRLHPMHEALVPTGPKVGVDHSRVLPASA